MKEEVSLTESKKPSKMRKAFFNAPYHIRHKFMTAPLSDALKAEYGIKRLPVRRGDKVLIVRGDYMASEGKVVRVDYKKIRIYVENVTRKKAIVCPCCRWHFIFHETVT